MITLFSLIVICSIWTLGIKIVTSEGMILGSVGAWAQMKVEEGNRIFEALITCHWCMPSLHSSIAILFAWGIGVITPQWNLIIYYPLVAMGTSLVNGLVWGHHLKQDAEKEYYEKKHDWDNYLEEYESSDIFDYENIRN